MTQTAISNDSIFNGRAAQSSRLGSHLLGSALCGAALGLAGWIAFGRGLSIHDTTQTAGLIGALVLLFAGLAIILRATISVMSIHFRIDGTRVEVERGLLMKKIDNLELWRVKDIRFRQGILQRMLGQGTIELDSSDMSDQVLTLMGLSGARAVYDRLRDAIDQARTKRGVIAVDATTSNTQ